MVIASIRERLIAGRMARPVATAVLIAAIERETVRDTIARIEDATDYVDMHPSTWDMTDDLYDTFTVSSDIVGNNHNRDIFDDEANWLYEL